MSDMNTNTTPPFGTPSPFNSGTNPPPKKRSNKRPLALLGLVLVLIAGAAAGLYVYNEQRSDAADQAIQDILNDPKKVQEKVIDIDATAFNGDVDGAYTEIDTLIDAQDDPREKSYLLLDKSLLAENYGSPEDALKAAQQAYDLNQDLSTVSRLAQAYELMDDTEQAIVYYKESLALVQDPDVPGASIDKNTFEAKIQELESQL